MDNKMTHQNTLLTQTKMCPKGFDDEQWGFLFVKMMMGRFGYA